MHGSQGSCDIPRAKLGVIWTLVSAVPVLGEVCHWDCHKEKITLRFVSLFSTCSPQEMRLLWDPCGLGIGNRSILSPLVNFGRERYVTDSGEKRQPPLLYKRKANHWGLLCYILENPHSISKCRVELQTSACASSDSKTSQLWGTHIINQRLLIPAVGWQLDEGCCTEALPLENMPSADSVANRAYLQLVLKLWSCY